MTEEEVAGASDNDDHNNDDKHDNDDDEVTMLQSPQTWRTMSATAINPYKQQSTLQSGDGNDVKEEAWQMGRRHDDGRQTMDNGY